MKTKGFLAIAILLLFCPTLFADEPEKPHILVYGVATTEVEPDEMIWYLTVKNTGPELKGVADRHNNIVKKTLNMLKNENVDEKEIQTAGMQFGENIEYKNQTRVREGYFASTYISFKLKDFDKYRDLWIGLADIEGVSLEGIYYDHSKRIDYQNETRKKALLAAKEKALAMAQTLESEIGNPLLIEEDLQEGSYSNELAGIAAVASEPDYIVLGVIPIEIRVKAAFELVTHK